MQNLANRDDVEYWLRDKSRESAVVIAARTVLRVIPVLASDNGLRNRGAHMADHVVLAVFRATAAAWFAARFPDLAAHVRRTSSVSAASAAVADVVSRNLRVADVADAAARATAAATAPSSTFFAARASTFFAARTSADAAAASARASASAAVVFTALSADASLLDGRVSPIDLAGRPLWPDGEPRRTGNQWARLKRALLDLDEDWSVWTSWYEARVQGAPTNEALEIARVMIAEKIWERGPKVVNAEIKRLIEEHKAIEEREIFESAFADDVQDARVTPNVPHQRPAAVEPIWQRGRLTVSNKPAKADLNKRKFEAALAALRAELAELANDVDAETNIDKRPAEFLRRLSARIPETMPRQDELFRLGHVETIFAGYAKTVDQEWPDFLASRYHAVSLQFDRTLRQAPLWREFKRNAARETLSVAQVADSTTLARQAASALQQGEAATFVDPAIPQSLEQLADALPVAKAGEEPPPDAIEAGKELLAVDLVESVNNTLKPIAEVALSAARDYVEGVGKGFKKAAKKRGPIDGARAFKWLRRLAIGGAAGGGSFVALSNLIAKFPEAFGWLERVLQVLK